MSQMMEYKGYCGSVKYSNEDGLLHGKIEFIRDLIAYQGKSVIEIERNFKGSVDDYLLTCKKVKKEPDRPFKGSFNIRMPEDLHRDAYFYAVNNNISLNEVVTKAVKDFLDKKGQDKYVFNTFHINSKSREDVSSIFQGNNRVEDIELSSKAGIPENYGIKGDSV